MKTVIFGFSRPKNLTLKPYAKLIMAVDGTDYDHGYIKFRNSWDVDFIYQASGSRTNFIGGELFRNLNVEVEEYAIDVEDDIEKSIGQLCVSREGKPYAVKQILGIGIMLLIKWVTFGKKVIENPFADGDQETDCIEEQAAILQKGLGIDTPMNMDSATVKPFRDWVAGLPNVRRIK